MTKLGCVAAAAVLSAAFATPALAQWEVTQEPGMIGFNYPNSNYLIGGYGVRLPYNSGKFARVPNYGGYAYYGPGYGGPGYYAPGVGIGVGPVGVGVGRAYGAYAYDPY